MFATFNPALTEIDCMLSTEVIYVFLYPHLLETLGLSWEITVEGEVPNTLDLSRVISADRDVPTTWRDFE